MPEVILPCPHCQSLSIGLCSGSDAITHELYNQAFCTSCGVSGLKVFADEISAITAWNNLPRAMTWTHEPPKVAGDCYVRTRPDESEQWDKPFVVFFSDGYLKDLKSSPLMQFAGPIPTPLD